ncbi:MAG: AsnC family transcriptional regulator [Capsulimonadales bacterium]|nr:AsnC family transcriptional regulator [Capsulimonadales bacterium]
MPETLTPPTTTTLPEDFVPTAPAQEMDETDRRLLNILQEDFPLVARPFAELGRRLGLTEDETLSRVTRLKAGHIIRQISAIFDSRMLGYTGSLVAMKVDPAREEEAAAIINEHPGVSHNYRRSHAYNLWFTLTLPPGMDLQEEIDHLAKKAGAERTWPLPTLKLYKIGVTMDMTGEKNRTEREAPEARKRHRTRDLTLTETDIALIRELQKDLPLTAEPFAELAANVDITVEELLAQANRFLEEGKMRRFAAVLHHRDAGFAYNCMAVWECPEERIEECGKTMATFKSVSHCYRRPTYEDWPYPLFTMVHGQSEEDCLTVVREIAHATGLESGALLYSTKEYKKVRVQYFTEDYARYLDREGRVRPLPTPTVAQPFPEGAE